MYFFHPNNKMKVLPIGDVIHTPTHRLMSPTSNKKIPFLCDIFLPVCVCVLFLKTIDKNVYEG